MDVDPLWFKKNMKYVSREEMGLTSGICLASRGSRVYYKENLETSEIGTSLIFSFGLRYWNQIDLEQCDGRSH